ncbi:MAG: hypothetical protein NTW21_30085 [Verrucomicrobia bacterium]|nr:hypothetical protein [Verrucomicrobiota bacterium]
MKTPNLIQHLRNHLNPLALAGAVLASAGVAQAGDLIVLDGTACTAKNELRPPANVTNGSGMTGTGPTATHAGNDPDQCWLSHLGLPQWFRVDLGATYSVENMLVWNGETGVGNIGDHGPNEGPYRGVKQADIYYSTDPTAPGNNFSDAKWTLLGTAGAREFAMRPNTTASFTYTDNITLGVEARVIGFDIKTNWGDYNHVASFAELEFFKASGGGGTTYASWASANGISANPSDDSNNDGVTNGVAYFMNKTGLATNPAINGTTQQVTWPNGGNIPSGQYGTQFVVQISSDLQTWTDVTAIQLDSNTDAVVSPPSDGSLSYTLTGASPRFVRLKVTPN